MVDFTWKPVKHYIETVMQIKSTDEEPIYLSEYNAETLAQIIEDQHKITTYMKQQGSKQLYHILIFVDDLLMTLRFQNTVKY